MSGFIAVHTGAGNNVDESKYQRVIKEACLRATDLLLKGGTAMDACETAIKRLENCGNTNAGFGSNLCYDGSIQCDASIMNGANLQFGACTDVSNVKNPIQLARIICDGQSRLLSMDRLPPMIMAGRGAEQYAEEMGCDIIDSKDLISSKAKFAYNHYKTKYQKLSSEHTVPASTDVPAISIEARLDTVGAVCVDGNGNTAAGCSSGGLLLKVPGRVGQAATFGAGVWAADTSDISVATCTTGNGEYIMRTFLAKEICTDLLTADCAVRSLHNTFKHKFLESPYLPSDQNLYAGALTLVYHPEDRSGEILWSQTTKSFCIGYMSTEQKTPKFVYSPLPNYCEPGRQTVVNGQNFHLRL